ncbi:MAG TPA: YihY/virulence factor BrkB family protein [Candidatus Angelobacter sp.]
MKNAIALIRQIAANFERKHLILAAAGLAYYFVMALVPVLIVLGAVLAFLPSQDGMGAAASFMANVVPRQALPELESMMATIAPHRTGMLSFGLVTAVWLASKAVKGIIMGLDMAYAAQTPRRIWTNRIIAFALTLAVGLLLLLGVMLTLAGPFVSAMLYRMALMHTLWSSLWPFVQWLLSVLIIFAAIELMYIVAPNMPAAGRRTVPGALFATASWIALAWGFGFYLHHYGVKLDKFYGVLATPIAFVIWLYWSAASILLGAEINSTLPTTGRPE